MKNISKLLAVVFAVMFVCGMFSACTQDTPSTGETQSPQTAKATATPAAATAAATPVAEPEIVDISMMHDAQWNTELMESQEFEIWNSFANKAGYNLDFVVIPHANYSEKLDVAFASGEVADIVFDWGVGRYVSGYVRPLDEYFAGDFADLKARVADSYWPKLTIAGQIWGYPIISTSEGAWMGFMIRKDWLDNLGLEMPETTDALASVLHAFTYDDPDGNGQNDTYGAIFRKDLAWFDMLGPFGMSSYIWIRLHCDLVDGKLVQQVTEQKFYDYLSYMRDLWADGVFEPNSFLNTSAQWEEVWASGRAGLICHYSMNAHTYFTKELQSVSENPNAQFDAVTKMQGPYGTGVNMDSAVTAALMVTTECETPEAALGVIRWMMNPTDEMEDFLRWGVEGKHYMTINGTRYRNPGTWNGDDNEFAQLGSADLFDENIPVNMDNIRALVFFNKFTDDPTYLSELYGGYGQRILASNRENNMPWNTLLEGKPELPEDEIIADLQTKILEHTVKIITGAEELDAGWATLQQDLKDIGIENMMVAWQKWYDENKK